MELKMDRINPFTGEILTENHSGGHGKKGKSSGGGGGAKKPDDALSDIQTKAAIASLGKQEPVRPGMHKQLKAQVDAQAAGMTYDKTEILSRTHSKAKTKADKRAVNRLKKEGYTQEAREYSVSDDYKLGGGPEFVKGYTTMKHPDGRKAIVTRDVSRSINKDEVQLIHYEPPGGRIKVLKTPKKPRAKKSLLERSGTVEGRQARARGE